MNGLILLIASLAMFWWAAMREEYIKSRWPKNLMDSIIVIVVAVIAIVLLIYVVLGALDMRW